QLINRDDSAGLAIEAADHAVILRAQFDSRDVLHADDSAIWSRAHHDVSELLGRGQAALRENGIGKLLVLGRGIAADLAGGIDGVLRLDCIDDVCNRYAELR